MKGRFGRPLEGSSVNYKNDYYKILKFIDTSKFNLKPSDSFLNSSIHRKYVTKCNDNNIKTLNCSTSNCIYLITCCRCGLQYVGETVQSLRDRFSGHNIGMKNPFAGNKCNILSKHFCVGLCRNANYHSHKKRKDSLERRAALLIFLLELEIFGVAVQSIHQDSKKW